MANYIIASKRTAVAPKGGAFSQCEIQHLAAPVINALVEHLPMGVKHIDELIVGNALGAGGNPARLIALASGLPESIAGLSLDRQCCAGLDAILLANDMLSSGRVSSVLAGGVESYSRRPRRFQKPLAQFGTSEDKDWQEYDQPAFSPWPDRDPLMSEAADNLAKKYAISINEQHQWAIASHQKALQAKHRIESECIALNGMNVDSFTRHLKETTCAKAKTISGTITYANTAVAADAAAFSLIVNQSLAANFQGPTLRIVSGCTIGGDPEQPGLAPVPAIKKALMMAGLTVNDLACVEMMEAYAVQAMACLQETGIDPVICNLGGGAIARGHPIGASGAILVTRLFSELNDLSQQKISTKPLYGLAAIAAAGGLGTAIIFEFTG